MQIAEQEIDVETALMRLVDDQGVVLEQISIIANLRQQDAIGHQLEVGPFPDVVTETDLVANAATDLLAQFGGYPAGQAACCDTTRLGMTDTPKHASAHFEADLG